MREALNKLFNRDLERFIENIEATPEEMLWKVPAGVSNSAGILAQHIAGNLQHYVGKVLGDSGYARERDREFISTGISKKELVEELAKAQKVLRETLPGLRADELEEDFPEVRHLALNKREFLLHLYGHLSYHLGQLNYLRRILSAG